MVLSALVLLGWTWAANKYFPTANPPSTKIENGKSQPLPQPQAQPAGPATPKAVQSVAAALGSGPRVRIETPDGERAEPDGGTLLIVSWVVLAVAAIWPRRA